MAHQTKIEVIIDETAKDTDIFKSIDCFHLNKAELFKYAILCWEVPSHIKEVDFFEHLQSKIPGMEMMISEFIEMNETSIRNLSNDDRVKKFVSEAVGVGVGLKYSSHLLQVNPNRFRKIPPAIEGKYLDYSVNVDNREFEIETKGTVGNYYNSMKTDILEKKKNNTNSNVYLKFGTITMILNSDEHSRKISKCVIVDDPPTNVILENNDLSKTQLLNYSSLLSYILDNKYYNRFVKPILKNKIDKVKIESSKFFGTYYFNNRKYLGEYFDYRLYKDNYEKYFNNAYKKSEIFNILTQKIGRIKIFIGLDVEIINNINEKDWDYLKKYSSQEAYFHDINIIKFLDKDGILIVKSLNGQDQQIENIFSEKVVESRLGLTGNYTRREWHECGAPCTSRGIEGKPCEKKTYRDHCHFHR